MSMPELTSDLGIHFRNKAGTSTCNAAAAAAAAADSRSCENSFFVFSLFSRAETNSSILQSLPELSGLTKSRATAER